MNTKPLIGIGLCVIVLLLLGSLSTVVGNQSANSTMNDSPLFCLKIKRHIHSQQNKITYRYLGEEKISDNDTTPPVTTCILNPPTPNGQNGWYISKITVTLNATDDDSGVNITRYQLDGGAWQTYDHSFNITVDDHHVVKYYSVDNASNTEPEKNITLSLDTKAPELELTYTWEGTLLCKGIIILTVTATDLTSGMNRVEFYYNNVIQRTIIGPGPLYVYEYPSSYEVKGFILNPEILEEHVKFHARIVMISGTTDDPYGLSVLAYDNAGWTAEAHLEAPTFQTPIIKPGFYIFRDVTLPNNYTGYIGKYFIRATFYNT